MVGRSSLSRKAFLALSLAATLATFLTRSRQADVVFLPLPAAAPPGVVAHDGKAVVPRGFDGYYHLRRIEQVARTGRPPPDTDPWLNFASGAPAVRPYWPLGYDTLVGMLARSLGCESRGAIWALACWVSPAIAALGCLLLCLLAAPLIGRGAAAGAGLFFALVPWADLNEGVGVVDHHGVEQWFAIVVPLLFLRQLGRTRPRAWVAGALLGCLGLVWTGGVLLLALLCAWGLAHAACDPKRRGLLATAQLCAAACVTTLAILPTSWWGRALRFDYTPLSWMLWAQIFGATVLFGSLWLARARLPRGPFRFVGVAGVVAAVVAGLLLGLVPPLRAGVLAGLGYLDKSDALFALVRESRPFHELPLGWPTLLWWLVLALQVLALAVWARRWWQRPGPERGLPLLWGLWGLGLVLAQSFRFSRWWDAPAALALGVCLAGGRRARVLGVLGLLLFGLGQARLWNTAASPRWYESAPGVPTTTGHHHLLDAVVWLAGNTPAVDAERPAWGVLAHPDLGHWLLGYARRPALGTPFGQAPAHIAANRRSFELLLLPVEELATAMQEGGYRYVIVHDPFRFPLGEELQKILGEPHASRVGRLSEAAASFGAGRPFRAEQLEIGLLHLWVANGAPQPDVPGSERLELVTWKNVDGLPLYKIFRLRP